MPWMLAPSVPYRSVTDVPVLPSLLLFFTVLPSIFLLFPFAFNSARQTARDLSRTGKLTWTACLLTAGRLRKRSTLTNSLTNNNAARASSSRTASERR